MGGACTVYEGEEKCIRMSVGKPEGKRPCVRAGHRWDDTVKKRYRNRDVRVWTGNIWFGIGTTGRVL